MTKPSLYIEQEIPSRTINVGGIDISVDREIYIKDLLIHWGDKLVSSSPEIQVAYGIDYSAGAENMNQFFKDKIAPKVFNNNVIMYQRSFAEPTLFQPVPNPDYVEGESPESEQFLTMGAFDFIVGELVLKNPHYLIPFLKLYILDNYEDGWFESAN